MFALISEQTCRGWTRLCQSAKLRHKTFSNFAKVQQSFQPLRILFCGSDDFSGVSLRRLQQEAHQDPGFIASIDVVCKTGKPSGRGLKKIRDVEIKTLAQELSLPLHEIPSFTGWSPPSINLILAVSFGLLVPPRVINLADYGGLNLHPSLLPEFRGPAPLQHTLLQGKQVSGITLQTLHPRHFDRGTVLAQEKYNLPAGGLCDINGLRSDIADYASNFLIKSLKQGLFVPPLKDRRLDGLAESHASKISTEDSRINWQTMDAERILRAQRAIAPLWSQWESAGNKSLRVQWHGLTLGPQDSQTRTEPAGTVQMLNDSKVGLWTYDGKLLLVEGMTIEGRKKNSSASSEMTHLLKISGTSARFV